ncbi:MAG: ABC transporter ATP-binding protein [Thermoprotei archaeon]|nr:MAG: ABC transporter ATP-binding protein [Thermoprotei archaeon]
MPDIEVRNVTKIYEERIVALYKVSVKVFDGEYVCIIGPSGSGKSSLIKVISGIIEPDEGEVYIGGRLVNNVPISERGLGLVMQDILLFPHMNVWDNVSYGPLVRGLGYDRAEFIGNEVLRSMSLHLRRSAMPHELSRGTQQKVAIARAVAAGARILLLDEPLGSVDPRAAKTLRFELRHLVKDLKLTALHITHNQEEALSIADRIIVMRKGRVEQVGTPFEIYARPKTPFIAKFIGGEASFLEGLVEETMDGRVKVNLGEEHVLVESSIGFRIGEKVVLGIRPEHVSIVRAGGSRPDNSISGIVKEVNFLGSYYRYMVETGGGNVLVKVPRLSAPSVSIGSRVFLTLDRAYIFKYPREGLDKAIAYE